MDDKKIYSLKKFAGYASGTIMAGLIGYTTLFVRPSEEPELPGIDEEHEYINMNRLVRPYPECETNPYTDTTELEDEYYCIQDLRVSLYGFTEKVLESVDGQYTSNRAEQGIIEQCNGLIQFASNNLQDLFNCAHTLESSIPSDFPELKAELDEFYNIALDANSKAKNQITLGF